MTDVWIDTDPSIGVPCHEADDGFALIQAFNSPELRIRGISASYGNARLPITLPIAQEMAARFGDNTPVFAGAASSEDLGRPTAATEALRAALAEGPLTYLALAPLTNLATFLQLHPEEAQRIERVIFVGGRTLGTRFRVGWNPYEFTDGNFHKDNAAAAILLDSALPITLVGVELAVQMLLRPRELRRIGHEGGDAGRWLAKKARLWMFLWRACFWIRGGVVFDCFAILAATHPHLLETEKRRAIIRDRQLLADPTNAGRAVLFCKRPLTEARGVLVDRLSGRI